MKSISIPVLLSAALCGANAHAGGYVTNSAGEIVRNAFGECWHAGHWTPEMIVPGCDRLEVDPVAAVIVEPVAVAVVEPAPPVLTTTPVRFEFDSAQLSTAEMGKLDVMIEAVRALAGKGTLELVGHADRIGAEGYNTALSERRAQAVRDYLAPRMHTAITFDVTGKGESMPQVMCPDQSGSALIACLAPNRRVDIEARLGDGS